jgi:hypothetical protein
MHAAVRPWVTTGVAIVGASVIAVTPVAPPPPAFVPQVQIPQVEMPTVQLTASIADIFTFPAFRQFVLNQIDDAITLGVGLAGSAAGLGQSIAAIPTTLATVTQQVLSGDLLGALTTVETYLVGSIVAVGEPTLAAIIERRQRVLAVSEAMQLALPQAIVDVVGGFGRGADEVLRAFIVAGQDLVDAVLSFSPGAIVSALVDGTQLVLGSFVGAGQHVVDGIVSAQQTIATALAAEPDPTLTTKVSNTEAADVPDLTRKTAMVAVSSPADTAATADADVTAATSEATTQNKPSETETPKADDQSTAKDDTTATADKPDRHDTKSPKADTEKKADDSSEHEAKKSANESKSEDAKQK